MSPGHPRVGVVVLNYRGVADTIACLESLAELDDAGTRDRRRQRLRRRIGRTARRRARRRADRQRVEPRLRRRQQRRHRALARRRASSSSGCSTTTPWSSRQRRGSCSPSPTPILASVPSVRCSTTWRRRDRVLTWGGGRVGRWTGRTRDARGEGDRVDYLTAASVLLRAVALRQRRLVRHPLLLHLGGRRPVHPAGRRRLAPRRRRAVAGVASLGRHARAAGAAAPGGARRRARRVPCAATRPCRGSRRCRCSATTRSPRCASADFDAVDRGVAGVAERGGRR